MDGACCAKKFPPKKQPPPAVPEKPPQAEVDAAFAKLAPKSASARQRATRARGSHHVTLHVTPSGHVTTTVTGGRTRRSASCVERGGQPR